MMADLIDWQLTTGWTPYLEISDVNRRKKNGHAMGDRPQNGETRLGNHTPKTEVGLSAMRNNVSSNWVPERYPLAA